MIAEARPGNVLLHTAKRLVCNAFFLLLLAGAVAGCATVRSPGPAPGGFELRGKMGIVRGDESYSARFLWRQDGSDFSIDLWGPLGQGRVLLTGRRDFLELRDGDGTVVSSGTPESVMQRHLGWSLPLAVLPEWVRGRPAPSPAASALTWDTAGQLSGFTQLGWQVELARYAQHSDSGGAGGSPLLLPHRVTASQGSYRVRLAVSDWRI